ADLMNPSVPLDGFYLTNTYRRPARAFIEQISTAVPDASGTLVSYPVLPPYRAYRDFPVAPVEGLQDTAGTVGQIIFGVESGQPTAYVPVDSPVPPQVLPIHIPGVLPASATDATYAVVVVGPGG